VGKSSSRACLFGVDRFSRAADHPKSPTLATQVPAAARTQRGIEDAGATHVSMKPKPTYISLKIWSRETLRLAELQSHEMTNAAILTSHDIERVPGRVSRNLNSLSCFIPAVFLLQEKRWKSTLEKVARR
jgi:hypothetical protein